jgi:Flp pilus assembly protein TadD
MADSGALERLELLVDLGRQAEASSGLAAFLAVEPENVRALLLYASVLDDLDQVGLALDAGLAAAALAPDEGRVHEVCAHLLSRAGRHVQAITAGRRAVRLEPHSWSAHYTLGRVILGERPPNVRAALAEAHEALRLAPTLSHTHNLVGICLDRLMMPEEAREAFTEAVRLDPTNATAISNLAGTHAERGRLRDASHLVTAGLSADAQESHLHQQYDFILYKLVRRFFWAEIGCGILVAALAGGHAPWWTRALTGLTMLATFIWIARDIFRRLPRGSQAHARGLLRRSKGWMRYGLVLFLVTTPAVVAMSFGPASWTLVIGLGVLVAFRFLGIIVILLGIGSMITNPFRRGSRG